MANNILFEIKVLDNANTKYQRKLETWHIQSVKELENWYKIMKRRHG